MENNDSVFVFSRAYSVSWLAGSVYIKVIAWMWQLVFQKQVIKTFLRQELFMPTFRLSKQMRKRTRSSMLFLYPCYYGENLQKLFLKYFFIWKIQKKFQWFGIPKIIISHHNVYFYNSKCSAGSCSHFIFHYSYLP